MDCINPNGDSERGKEAYACLHCKNAVTPGTILLKTMMLAAVAKELGKTRLQELVENHQGQKQRELMGRKLSIQKMIKDRQVDVTVFRQKAEVISQSANKALNNRHQRSKRWRS